MAKNLRKPKIGVKRSTRQRCCRPGCGVGVQPEPLALAAFLLDAYRAAIVRSAACGPYGGGRGRLCPLKCAGPEDCRKAPLKLCGLGCGR